MHTGFLEISTPVFVLKENCSSDHCMSYTSNSDLTVDPDFYSMNHLMLARTYMKLNEPAKAKRHLIKARDMPVKSADDKQAHDESIEILGRI